MVVILVHWLIRPGREADFETRWREMTVAKDTGLYREILTKLFKPGEERDREGEEKFHTFSVGDPFYTTYINVGVWKDVASFDAAIGKYIPQAKVVDEDGRRLQTVQLEEFEFKLRERAILHVIGSRGGDLPAADVP